MRTRNYFKYLLAAIVAIGTSFNAMAQDLGKVTITFQENSGSYCSHLNLLDWGGTKHQAPTPVYTPNNLGLEISEYEGVHNDWNGAYIGWERGTIYFKNTFKYKVRAVEWDISRGGLFDMRGKTWFGNPSNVEPQDYTIDNKTDDSNSKIYTSGNDQYLDQISLKTEDWSGGKLDLFHLKIRKLVIYYYKPEVIVSLSNIKDSEGKAYTLQNGKDMSVGSTGKLSASLGTKHLGRFVASDVTFKYYSANSNIATIDETTGEISAKSSGSVVLTAKMYDNAGNEISDASYVLFVFDKNEGMVWTRNNVSVYNNTTGVNNWSMSNTLSSGVNDWTTSSTLKGGSLIWDIESGVSGVYREFASFSVPGNALYRTIAQNISCTVSLPKYSSMDYKPTIAGSLMTEDVVEYGVRYGLEAVDLGKQNNSTSITWNTNSTANNTTSVGRYRTGSTPYTMLRGGAENNKEENKLFGFINIIKDANDNYLPLVGDSYQVGSDNNNSAIWKGDNKNGASTQDVTYNLVVMSYLWGSTIKNYPASSLFGYSGVPEYTYYAHVSFYNNYKDDEASDFLDRVTLASRGRNVVAKLSHSSFVPNREGYRFLGWSTVKGATTIEYQDQGDFYCFDPVNGGGKGEVKLYAVWESKTYSVALSPNGGTIPGAEPGRSVTVNAIFGEPMPSKTKSGADVAIPDRAGYDFKGYFTEPNGGTMYYDENMQSVRSWDIDYVPGPNDPYYIYLHAHWSLATYPITIDPNGGSFGENVDVPVIVNATYSQKLPLVDVKGDNIPTPTRDGYIFLGYSVQENNPNNLVYSINNGNLVTNSSWNTTSGATLYAQWEKVYYLTLDAGSHAVIPTTIGAGNCEILQRSDGIIKICVSYGQKVGYIYNGKPKNAGFDLIGFYDDNDVLVATVDLNDPNNRDIHFTNENNTYFRSQDGEWNYPNNLTLTAKYLPKYTLEDDNIIKFGSETHTVVLEVEEDWAKFTVNDLVGAVRAETESGRISTQNPVMVFDLRNTKYINGASSDAKSFLDKLWQNDYKDYISPNVLVYLNAASGINQRTGNPREDTRNAILYDGTCPNLYIIDRIPMKIPYEFKAINATYERNRVQSEINDMEDAMWKQSYESVWGTLCLPYPIKNNNSHKVSNEWNAAIDCEIKFYELRGTHDNYMQFYEMEENATIPANTPVLYCRTKGVGSAVSITERSNKDNIAWATPEIKVPANGKYVDNKYVYKTTPIEYGNKTQVPLAEESISDWRFVGTLEEKTFIGYDYKTRYGKAAAAGAIEVEKGRDIYYFASNKFTHMNPELGKLVVLPYRAYFEDRGAYSESKVSSYSILVVDEDGTTTDITNLIDNSEAKGDGKIYDLSGRRVKQPVKGSIYIIDGKKKMY